MYGWMAGFVGEAEGVRGGRRGCLFNLQAEIEILPYIIHPVLLGLYALYQKEKILWKNEY